MKTYQSAYLMEILNPRSGKKVLSAFFKYIQDSGIKFDTVVCRGTSGLLVGPAVARKFRAHLIVVRKDDGNHAGTRLEGYLRPRRYIIVDDIIASGATVEYCLDTVRMCREVHAPKCVGIFLYRSWSSETLYCNRDGRDTGIPRYNMVLDTTEGFQFRPPLKRSKPVQQHQTKLEL